MQGGPTDHTYYTRVNMTRTIEQILGLTPMNQFDLVASPMRIAFVKGKPPKSNFDPVTHLSNEIKPDSEDPNIVNHLNWYEATGFTRAFPGENRVMHPSEFKISSAPRVADLDD